MDWLARWQEGRTGWHETNGNRALPRYRPTLAPGSRVLVPLCGKTPDLHWLAIQGLEVTGVELSDIAAAAFFEEAGLEAEVSFIDGMKRYSAIGPSLDIFVGDYFDFKDPAFDALYDRASLVALPPHLRPEYIRHTKRLLKASARMLLVTLEYEQSLAGGPPYSVQAEEVKQYWPNAKRMEARDDMDDIPPKFRQAGVSEFLEVVWLIE